MNDLYVTTGAAGDVANSLPLAYDAFRATGRRSGFLISKDYAGLLDGVSYVVPEVFDGHYSQLPAALEYAKTLPYSRILVVQTYGLPVTPRTDSFAREAWQVIGRGAEWGSLPLVFDRRDRGRESLIWAQIPADKPWVLVAHTGLSSPFPHRLHLMNTLSAGVGDKYRLIDLSQIKCERIYDLLGLFERAEWLVSIDTAHLHLAASCPQLKVVAFIADSPSVWHGSPPTCQQVIRIRYAQYHERVKEMVAAINNPQPRRLHHCWSDYHRAPDAEHRHWFACSTWNREQASLPGQWVSHRVDDSKLSRNSKSLGDPRGVPFVSDLLNAAAAGAADNDLILLTNDDTCLAPGLGRTLLSLRPECSWGHRHDFDGWETPPGLWDIVNAPQYPGVDLFCMTARFWREHQHEYPDMVLGSNEWDLVMRELMRENGGVEIPSCCYHWTHVTYWSMNKQNPGNVYNRRLANAFLVKRGSTVWDFL